MRYYIGLIHKDDDSDFGISFPDFPGCVSAGVSLQDALAGGQEALAGHMALMAEQGQSIPEPSSLDAVLADPENRDAVPVVVAAPPVAAKAVRVNITLAEDVLRAIDAYAEDHGFTRSGFIAAAARRAMADEVDA